MVSMAPIQVLKAQLVNSEIEEQSLEWDAETHLYEFECALDALDLMSDGLPDDQRTSNALNGLHSKLSNIHAIFTAHLIIS